MPPPVVEPLQQGKILGPLGITDRSTPPPQDDKAVQLAQLRELKAKLDEDHERLAQLERALEQDQPHTHGGGTHGHAREVYQQIIEDEELEPLVSRFPRVG
jgi:hypothetical protein